MELSFRTRQLRAICEDDQAAARRFDEMTVRALHARLADLRAAETVRDLIAGSPEFSPDQPMLTLDVVGGCYLVCRAYLPLDKRSRRRIDWDIVRRIQVIEIRRGGRL
jgi:proteic killer suppression protein